MRRTRRTLSARMILILVIILVIILGVSPAMAMTVIPTNYNVNLTVSNAAGARFDDFGDDTYNFFNPTQSSTQGQNALHIADDNATNNFGEVTFTTDQSGVFYMTDTGGRGWNDDGILMLGVNGTVPDNFRLHIRSSGYTWTPVPTGSYPDYDNITYVSGALDEYFTKADFLYGPQIWRPAPGEGNYYPIVHNQDMTDSTNTFSIMFIDLNAGIIGPNTLSSSTYSGKTLTDNGAIRIEYSFENLATTGAFDAYAYTVSSNQGQGIRWTNRLSTTSGDPNGWFVSGRAPVILPGQAKAPTDPDGDGLYEDLNGNGDLDFSDVILYFNNLEWIESNEPVSFFDYNGNDEIDFNDLVLLFMEV